MAEGIGVPGLDKVNKKYVIAGVFVAGGVAIIVFLRARSSASSAGAQAGAASAASTTAQVTDPAGNECTALDPNSGYCPGSAEDSQYYAEQSSTLEDEDDEGDSTGGSAGTSTSGYDAAGYPIGSAADLAWQASQTGGSAAGTSTTGTSGAATTNSQWLTEALTEVPGDAITIQTALASVLGGVTVTTAQQDLFLEAVGILGQPPQGYPAIHLSDSPSQPVSTAKQVTVPNVIGKTAGAAHNAIVAAGLKPVADAGQKATAKIVSQNPKSGTKVNSGSSVVITT